MNRIILLIALLSVNITSAIRVDWVVPCSFQHKLIQNNNENILEFHYITQNNSKCLSKCYHMSESNLNQQRQLTCINPNITMFNMKLNWNPDLNSDFNSDHNTNYSNYDINNISFQQFIKHIYHLYEDICIYKTQWAAQQLALANSEDGSSYNTALLSYNPPPNPFHNLCNQNKMCCHNITFNINFIDTITKNIYSDHKLIATNSERYYLGYTLNDIIITIMAFFAVGLLSLSTYLAIKFILVWCKIIIKLIKGLVKGQTHEGIKKIKNL